MLDAIAEKKDLIVLHTFDDEIYFKECTMEYYKQFYKNWIVTSCGTVLSGSSIKKAHEATATDYFRYFVLPKYPNWIKKRYSEMESRLSDKQKKEIKLESIIWRINEIIEEEKYYSPTNKNK